MTTCCYHKSEKSWTQDPDGMRWEAFFTHHETEERGSGPAVEKAETAEETTTFACCPACGQACHQSGVIFNGDGGFDQLPPFQSL